MRARVRKEGLGSLGRGERGGSVGVRARLFVPAGLVGESSSLIFFQRAEALHEGVAHRAIFLLEAADHRTLGNAYRDSCCRHMDPKWFNNEQ